MADRTFACPLCRADASAATAAGGGACPGCGAAIGGGAAGPVDAVAAALAGWGADGVDPGAVARRLFETEPAPAPAPTAAIASDRGDGFYSWWVVVRPGEDGPGAVLAALIA